MLRKARELERHELRARDGTIGLVQDFFFDDRRWTVRYLVVDTGRWLESREVLISPAAVERVDAAAREIVVNLTRAQVQGSPAVDPRQPVSREHEAALLQHYHWPAYWGAIGFADAGLGLPIAGVPGLEPRAAARNAAPAREAAVAEDYHLRSVRAVTGHAIEARDGAIGHVEDFLIDEASWELGYLIVDPRNRWRGRKVLVAPAWINEVGWDDGRVRVALTRAAVKASPPYDPDQPPTGEYLAELRRHYAEDAGP